MNLKKEKRASIMTTVAPSPLPPSTSPDNNIQCPQSVAINEDHRDRWFDIVATSPPPLSSSSDSSPPFSRAADEDHLCNLLLLAEEATDRDLEINLRNYENNTTSITSTESADRSLQSLRLTVKRDHGQQGVASCNKAVDIVNTPVTVLPSSSRSIADKEVQLVSLAKRSSPSSLSSSDNTELNISVPDADQGQLIIRSSPVCNKRKSDHQQEHTKVLKTEENSGNIYQCNICDKSFTSFRALGGHKSWHTNKFRKRTYQKSAGQSLLNPTPKPSSEGATTSSHLHKCRVCDKSFTKGQALGGHMTLHLLRKSTSLVHASPPTDHKVAPTTVRDFDLNQPAPLE